MTSADVFQSVVQLTIPSHLWGWHQQMTNYSPCILLIINHRTLVNNWGKEWLAVQRVELTTQWLVWKGHLDHFWNNVPLTEFQLRNEKLPKHCAYSNDMFILQALFLANEYILFCCFSGLKGHKRILSHAPAKLLPLLDFTSKYFPSGYGSVKFLPRPDPGCPDSHHRWVLSFKVWDLYVRCISLGQVCCSFPGMERVEASPWGRQAL